MGYLFPIDKLPYLNFDGPVNYEDLTFFQNVMQKELLQRLLFTIGSYRTSGAQFGIVDEQAPTSIEAGEENRPLQVELSTAGNLTMLVRPGYAVTPNGMIIYIEQAVDNLVLLTNDPSCVHVVYLEWELKGLDLAQDDYGTLAPKYYGLVPDASLVHVALLNDFNALNSAELQNIVPLVVVTVSHDDCSVVADSLVFDYTMDTYSWNRPWFSPVDIQHRSELGTGPTTVPHNLSLNDLGATGDLTILDLELPHGVVVSKDDTKANSPGVVCTETLTTLAIDVDGSVTGIVGTTYATLGHFPIRLGLVWDDDDAKDHPNHFAYPAYLLPDTNIIVIPPLPEASKASQLTARYTRAYAAEPNLDSIDESKLMILEAQPNEALVAGGKAFSSFTSLEYDMREAEPMPCYFKVFGRPDPTDTSKLSMFTSPHVLLTQKRITDIQTAGGTQEIAATPIGPAYIRVGITRGYVGAACPGTFEVKFKITGLNEAGNSVLEWFKFTSTYVKPGACSDTPEIASFLIGKMLFVSDLVISDITVDATVASTAALIVYADYHQFVSPFLDSALPIANLVWNGSRISQLFDKRPVHQFLRKGSRNTSISEAALSAQLATDQLWQNVAVDPLKTKGIVFGLAEDMNDSHYSDMVLSDYFRMDDGLDFWSLPNAPITKYDAGDPEKPIILSATVDPTASYFVWVSRAINVMGYHPTAYHPLYTIDTIIANMFHETTKVGWDWDKGGTAVGNPPLWIRVCWIDAAMATLWTDWTPMTQALNHYKHCKALAVDQTIIAFQLAIPMTEFGIDSSVNTIRRFLRTTGVVAYATHQLEVVA